MIRRPLSSLKKSKRGFVGDIGIVIGLLFAFSIIFVIGFKLLGDFNNRYQDTDASTQSKQLVDDSTNSYVATFDGMYLFLLFGLAVALFLSTSYIDTRPEFFFITAIAAVIFVGMSAVVSNAYETFADSPSLVNASGSFLISPSIMGRLPLVTLVLVVSTLLGLYFKSKNFYY